MIKICVIGDIHREYKVLHSLLDECDADIYLQVGDLGGSKRNNGNGYPVVSKPMMFIAGNHEDFSELEEYNNQPNHMSFMIKKNLWYLPLGHYTTIKGLRIGGLGGNYASSRYNLHRHELHQDRRRHYTIHDVRKLKQSKKLDVLLTHEASSPFLIKEKKGTRDAGRLEINDLIEELKPKYHFYGHHHRYRETTINKTISICVPLQEYIEIKI